MVLFASKPYYYVLKIGSGQSKVDIKLISACNLEEIQTFLITLVKVLLMS